MRLDEVISRAGDVTPVEHLPTMCKAIGSIPSTEKRKPKKTGARDSSVSKAPDAEACGQSHTIWPWAAHACNLSTGRWRQRDPRK